MKTLGSKKNLLTFSLALTLIIVVLLTGCSPKGTTDGSGSSSGTSSSDGGGMSSVATNASEKEGGNSGDSDIVNLDSVLPIVKDGNKVELKIVIAVPDGTTNDPLNRWFWQWMDEYCNIKPNVEAIFQEALNERKSLMFVSGDMADLFLFPLANHEVMKYGVNEGRLMAFNEYIDTYMPNMKAGMEAYPSAKGAVTTPDGNMYSIPALYGEIDVTGMQRIYINDTWLTQLGIEMPATIDDFMDTMRTFKNSAAELGVENVIPLGGGFSERTPLGVFLQGLGYVTGISFGNDATTSGLGIALLDGEPTFPCDDDLFLEYLKLAKTCYDEELISSNFFTLDSTQVAAEMADNSYGFFSNPLHANIGETSIIRQFTALTPLTSQWNDTPKSMTELTVGNSSFYVNANTEYKEVCARFADLFYSEYCAITWPGPIDGSDMAMGWEGLVFEDGIWTVVDQASSLWQSALDNWHTSFFATGDLSPRSDQSRCELAGIDAVIPTMLDKEYWNPDVVDSGFMNWSVVSAILPYRVDGYPNTVYMTDEQTTKITDLKTVIEPYVKEQVALFISGERSLDEFEAYQNELKTMGIDEYEQIYKDIYTQYQQSN